MHVDISVIVPTFRRPAQVLEAVSSALDQQNVGVEVLVLDDSPEGSARAAIEGIGDPRVSYRKREPPSGGNPSLVRNEGWPAATGRYVHFLDDDDRVAEGAYRAFVDVLDAHPDRGMAFGRVEPFGDNAEVLEQQRIYFAEGARRALLAQKLGASRRFMTAQMLFNPTPLVNSACVVRRDCIPKLGGYDPRIKVVEDVDFYIRAIRDFGFVFMDRVVLHYRTGAPSIMHDQKDAVRVAKSYRIMFDEYRAAHGRVEFELMRLFGRTVARWL